MFKPPGSYFCLKDFTDFPVGDTINIPGNNDFQIGDPVVFTNHEGATLAENTAGSAYSFGVTYFVVGGGTGTSTLKLSLTKGGAAITVANRGGTGTADTAGAHVNIAYAAFDVVCSVVEWGIDFSRDSIDTTTIPCSIDGTAAKFANFKESIAGPAEGTGSMTVLFTPDQSSTANRLIYSTLLADQNGAEVKLYLNYVDDPSVPGGDDTASMYIQAPVVLNGFDVSATTSDALTATINFSLAGTPSHMFYTTLN
jgi:hypothetical protein